MKLIDYAGVIHIHSEYSFDGSVPVADIITAAAENGIDFLMLTDHGHLMARDKGLEGWHGDTLLIVGQEISPRFNHYLAFQIERAVIEPEDVTQWEPQQYIDQVAERGGFGIIAHPDHEGAPTFHVKHYPWNEWGVRNFDGMGIWDFMTDWQSSLTWHGKALASYLFPFLFLHGPREVTLRRWDDLNRTRPIVGVAECDNHSTRKRILGFELEVFPFRKAFRYLRTHLLLERPFVKQREQDIAAVYNALRRGRAYVSHDYLAPATGFTFTATDGGQIYHMGDVFTLWKTVEMNIRLPVKGKIRVLADGETVHEDLAQTLSLEIKRAGVYRVEASLKTWGRWRPWIFSNPIYIRANGDKAGGRTGVQENR